MEIYVNFSDSAVPQTEEIDITSVPGADAYYHVTIVGPTGTRKFAYPSFSADTNTTQEVAAGLAEILDAHPDIHATVLSGTPSTITIKSLVPGQSFTCTVSCTNQADNTTVNSAISTSTVTPASGTVRYGKMFDLAAYLSVQSGQFRAQVVGRSYDGSNPSPTLVGGETTLSKASPLTTAQYTA